MGIFTWHRSRQREIRDQRPIHPYVKYALTDGPANIRNTSYVGIGWLPSSVYERLACVRACIQASCCDVKLLEPNYN